MMHNTWPATLSSLTSLQGFIDTYAARENLDIKTCTSLSLIVEEVAVNIITHAYHSTGEGTITIELDASENTISIRFSDTGPRFDPLTAEEPDITKDIDQRDIGGLGLLMVRQLADKITYQRHDQRNILTVTMQRKKEK